MVRKGGREEGREGSKGEEERGRKDGRSNWMIHNAGRKKGGRGGD